MLEILLAGTLDDDYHQWTDQKVDQVSYHSKYDCGLCSV